MNKKGGLGAGILVILGILGISNLPRNSALAGGRGFPIRAPPTSGSLHRMIAAHIDRVAGTANLAISRRNITILPLPCGSMARISTSC